MCGGKYKQWKTPRQLIEINGEPIVARTIRLLHENGIEDIAISSDNPAFERFGVPILHHENSYIAAGYNNWTGHWCDAFYPTAEQACYIFGDVVFSPEAIRIIVETETDDIEFFASAPPFDSNYTKQWSEPFALKVMDQHHLRHAIGETKRLYAAGKFNRKPLMWELWQVIKKTQLNTIVTNYTVINDYTCDIDYPEEANTFENIVRRNSQ